MVSLSILLAFGKQIMKYCYKCLGGGGDFIFVMCLVSKLLLYIYGVFGIHLCDLGYIRLTGDALV